MKIISKTLKILPLLFAVVAFQGCSDDDEDQVFNPTQTQPNIVQLAQDTPALASLVAAIGSASGDLGDVLSGNGPFTVLAPTNEAFQALLDSNPEWNTVDDIDDATLEQVLRNHVIPANLLSTDLPGLTTLDGRGYAGTLAEGAGGENLDILFDTNGALPVFNNVATVVSAELANISASNGTVHVIDAVIPRAGIVDHVVNNESLSSLEGALLGEGLVPLPGLAPHTVFAPTNTAFMNYTNPNSYALASVLANHVVSGAAAFSGGLSTGYGVSTLATSASGDNVSLFIETDGTNVTLNGSSNVVVADVVGLDGVIHIVDEVIDIPTIATFATTNDALGSLVAALQLADTGMPTVPWIGTVSDATAGPFTVFAPTNGAFDDLLLELDPTGMTMLGDLDPGTVDSVLLVHVANGNVRAEALNTLMGTVPTLGADLAIDVPTLTITDNNGRDIGIVAELTNIQAVNGVVHVVSRVILPNP